MKQLWLSSSAHSSSINNSKIEAVKNDDSVDNDAIQLHSRIISHQLKLNRVQETSLRAANFMHYIMAIVAPLPRCLGLLVFLSILSTSLSQSDLIIQNYTYQDLKPCTMSSPQLGELGPNDDLEPCIMYEVLPTFLEPQLQGQLLQPKEPINGKYNGTSVITMVQVSPSNCFNHRDGAPTAVHFLNGDHQGRGVAIGFEGTRPNGNDELNEDTDDDQIPLKEEHPHYVQFHFVSVVAGNPAAMTEEEYNQRHEQILNSMISYLDAPYIVGSCSFASTIEKQIADDNEAFLMAQVGPPGFYTDNHPYVFGFHINSDLYPLPNVQSLSFLIDRNARDGGDASEIPIKVIYRTKSEFFYSTCKSAVDHLRAAGFTKIEELMFDHAGDHDDDGVTNEFDEDFLRDLADQACKPDHAHHEHHSDLSPGHPALFVCTLVEHDIMIRRWLETGCRPISTWVTAATWGWADENPDLVPYFQGGGQWHPAFTYNDMYFDSGSALLAYNERLYGYAGNYDQVVDYAIPVLFAQHLVSAYRVVDDPDPIADFGTPSGREALRRDMLILKADTIFGPVSFDENQRNKGREAAGSQWLPNADVYSAEEGEDVEQQIQFVKMASKPEFLYANRLVAPFLQAEAATVVVADSAKNCPAGNFINETMRVQDGSILKSGCAPCPVDTFQPGPNKAIQCATCPYGSTTKGLKGQEMCYALEDNLLSPAILAFGYLSVALTWALSFSFMAWLLIHRKDPVVKMSQMEFLTLICVGAMISSSTIIALSFQAGTGASTQAASAGCTAAPFLYAIGWALQYSSLSAKTYRLYLIMRNNQRLKRVKVTFLKMLRIVFVVLAIDLAVLISWVVVSPLSYERSEENINIDEEAGVITIDTVGSCVMENDSISILAFAGPIMGFHLMLLIGTNCLLYSVRNVADRYQEQKYIAMASVLMFEILVVGIPVMVAVNDSPVATHIILVGIIAVSDIGTLCFTFIPKILFQRSGLEEGVSFGESILRSTHRLASMRESALRQNGESLYHCGPSTEFSRRMVRESNNDSIGEIREGPRIQSTSRRNLLHENIAEEDAKDVAEEQPQSDLNTICMDDEGEHLCQARIMQRAAEKGVMEQSERKSNERSQATSENEIVDDQRCAEPASLVNEHERMMKMTAKLMEEHEQMMKTTASILSEQEKYRSWLLDEEGKTKGAPKDEEGKVERRLSPSAPIPRVIETSTDDECGKDRVDVINPTRYQSEVTEMTEDTSKEYTAEKKKVAKTMREYSADLNGDHSD